MSKNSDSCMAIPHELLRTVFKKIAPGSEFLDLGCGRGRDSLFMLAEGFSVTAVDKSENAIKEIADCVRKNNLPKDKIKLFCKDIRDFDIAENKYSIINAFNSLQFLAKEDALPLIEKIKRSLKNHGYIVVSGFTLGDPLYKNPASEGRCFFGSGELKSLFSSFAVAFYKEMVIFDPGHSGQPMPHEHHVVRLIAQKP